MPKDAITDPVLPRIHTIRKQRVVLDADLARLYEVQERLQPLLNPPPGKPKRKIGFHAGNR